MPRPPRAAPKAGAEDGWPLIPMPDPIHEAQRRFVANLREAMDGMSIRAAANLSEVDRGTLTTLLEGDSWVDAVALAKLERAFQRNLWPGYIDD